MMTETPDKLIDMVCQDVAAAEAARKAAAWKKAVEAWEAAEQAAREAAEKKEKEES